MPEEFDQQEQESFDLQRWLGAARRRYLHFLIPLFFGWLIVWGASWVLPPVYRSGTLILVEQPTMPKDYVTPNVSDDLQERLQSITQQILSRTRLLQIIEQSQVYGNDGKMSADEKIERMRKDIEIDLVHDAHNDKITAFNVYYSARDPRLAQKVTSELTNLFINENVEVRQQQSEDTTQFLEAQLDCPEYIVRAGRENTRVQRTTRWRNAHATAEQSADSQRVAITASKCGRWPEHGEAAAYLSSDLDRPVPDSSRNGLKRR